jgi:hypothetical protein
MTACKLQHAVPILITSLVVSVAANAHAQDEEPAAAPPVVVQSTTPIASSKPKPLPPLVPTGFAMDARLVRAVSGGLGWAGDGLPPVALGYRGERFALTLGPFYSRSSAPVGISGLGGVGSFGGVGGIGQGQPVGFVTGESELSHYGGTLLTELVLFRTDDKRTAAHGLVGATLAETKGSVSYGGFSQEASMPATYGLSVGAGLRHWLTPNFGVSVEGGESYVNSPSGIASMRTKQMSTFGALGVSLVL